MTERQVSRNQWRRMLAVVVATLAVPIIPFLVVGELPGQSWLEGAESRGGAVGSAGAVLLAMDVFLPIPSSIIGTLLGARLGLAVGFAWSCLGLVIGHMIGFGIGRLWPARFAPAVADVPSGLAVLLSRPVPVFAEAVAMGAGATRMPLRTYAFWCITGDVIYALVLAANGAQFLPEKVVIWALLLPLALPVLSWLLWKGWQQRRRANS